MKQGSTCQTFWKYYWKREKFEIKSPAVYRGAVGEFVGCFLLAFFGVGCNMLSANQEPVSSVHVALETGFYIAVAITTFGTISGGHVNPSISMGFFATGQISTVRFLLYVICQTLGCTAGAGIVYMLTVDHIRGGFGVILPNPRITDTQALFCEMIITFALCFGTLAMVDDGRKDVNGFAPLMIGLLVSINVFAGWNISGGCMNPARNLGPAIIVGKTEKMWLYWAGDLIGAALGALLYDRIFSTKVCLRWTTQSCLDPREVLLNVDFDNDQFNREQTVENSVYRKSVVDNGVVAVVEKPKLNNEIHERNIFAMDTHL